MSGEPISTPLHLFGDALRELLLAVPMSVVRVLFVACLVSVLICVLRLPRSEVVPDRDGPIRWDENLKLWASVALILQILIYCLV
jgi:hypothetical protein